MRNQLAALRPLVARIAGAMSALPGVQRDSLWFGARSSATVLLLAVILATVAAQLHLLSERLNVRGVSAEGFILPEECRDMQRPVLPVPGLPAAALSPEETRETYRAATSLPGRWIDLTTLEWETATSGWAALADFNVPRRGMAFTNTPLTAMGQVFPSGIGTYPFSEVVYDLGGAYGALRGRVALDDWAPDGGSARFSIYADDVLLYRSPVRLAGQEALDLGVPLMGANQLRLVVDDADGDPSGDYADWLGVEVFRPKAGPAVLTPLRARLAEARGRSNPMLLTAANGPVEPVNTGAEGGNEVRFDETRCLIVVGNKYAQATFGYGGAHHGQLSIFSPEGGLPALVGAVGAIHLVAGGTLSLADTQPVQGPAWVATPVEEGALGSGQQVRVNLQSPDGDLVYVDITLYDEGFLTYQIRPAGTLAAQGYDYLGGTAGGLVGDGPRFMSERGRVWRGRIAADGLERSIPLEPGKPLLLWSEASRQGIVMATIDESEAPMEFSLTRHPGVPGADLGLTMSWLPIELHPGGAQASPRLWIQFVDAKHVLDAFFGYRSVISRLYPSSPVPDWVRYQWNSWWVYGPTPTEERLRRQIDYISENLADLGPWSVIVDAVWHVAYGRPTADMRNVDYEKFPGGIRTLSDYAHGRDVKVVLFMSAGFVHVGEEQGGEWLALRGLIEEHPDWLIPLFDTGGRRAYMLNYAHPGVQGYMQAVVDDFISVHGVDGIQLDGLADPEGQFTDVRSRDLALSDTPYLPATYIYRLVASRLFALRPDAYLEGGWINPVFAHPYAHSFWWADDWPSFDNPYPFPGLRQHIDYALFQRVALGQQPKLAHALGDPNSRDIRRWFEAALALGAQVSASFDLTMLDASNLSALRTLLAHYRPFEGQTVASSHRRPSAFATTVDHITYLGVLNRTSRAAAFEAEIAELGVLGPDLMAYDVENGTWLPSTSIPAMQLQPRSFRLFLIPHQPRIVWSNASWTYERADDQSLVATVRGPATLGGFAEIWAPQAKAVLLDRTPLQLGSSPGDGQYTYDAGKGVIRLSLQYDAPHHLEIQW